MAGLKTIPEIISSKRSVKPDWPLPIIEDLLTFNEFSPQITKTLASDTDNMVHLWSMETNRRRKSTPRSDDVKSDRWRIYCTTQAFSNVNFEINKFLLFSQNPNVKMSNQKSKTTKIIKKKPKIKQKHWKKIWKTFCIFSIITTRSNSFIYKKKNYHFKNKFFFHNFSKLIFSPQFFNSFNFFLN